MYNPKVFDFIKNLPPHSNKPFLRWPSSDSGVEEKNSNLFLISEIKWGFLSGHSPRAPDLHWLIGNSSHIPCVISSAFDILGPQCMQSLIPYMELLPAWQLTLHWVYQGCMC